MKQTRHYCNVQYVLSNIPFTDYHITSVNYHCLTKEACYITFLPNFNTYQTQILETKRAPINNNHELVGYIQTHVFNPIIQEAQIKNYHSTKACPAIPTYQKIVCCRQLPQNRTAPGLTIAQVVIKTSTIRPPRLSLSRSIH